MAKLTVVRPTVGEKNVVAEPKVDNALLAIETWANGNVGKENLENGGVEEAALATAVATKLNAKTGAGLTYKTSSISRTAEPGELIEMTAGGTTVTISTFTANALYGVFNRSSGEVKVKLTGGARLYGDFINGATEVVLLENQHLLMQANGTNLLIVAGGLPGMRVTYHSAEFTFTPGEFAESTTNITGKLPKASEYTGQRITAFAGNGTQEIKCEHGEQIYGPSSGLPAGSILLENHQSVEFIADNGNWIIVAGGPTQSGRVLQVIDYGRALTKKEEEEGASVHAYIPTSTFAALDTTNLRAKIVAPPSGNVMIHASAYAYGSEGNLYIGVLSGSTEKGRPGIVADGVPSGTDIRFTYDTIIEGLMPGATYNLDLAAKAEHANKWTIIAGQGGTTGTTGGVFYSVTAL
jgi:hypothetical protein